MLDLAVLRSLSIRLVIVHGAAHQIVELSRRNPKRPISNADGTGITDEETLKLALTAANRITHEVLEGLASNDLRAAYTNAVIAHPLTASSAASTASYTGRVEKVDTEFLNQLLEKGVIPVIAPLGFDGDGRTFRVQLRRRRASRSPRPCAPPSSSLSPTRNGFTKNGQEGQPDFRQRTRRNFSRSTRPTSPRAMVSKFEHSIQRLPSTA